MRPLYTANDLRDRAVQLAEQGNLRAAMPHFRAAIALSPADPQLHSDEGVTWMRLGEYEPAWGRIQALADPRPELYDSASEQAGTAWVPEPHSDR